MLKHQPELLKLCELVYHANGSIRGKLAIRPEDFRWLDQLYVKLTQENGELKQFVLRQAVRGPAHCTDCAADAKRYCGSHTRSIGRKTGSADSVRFLESLSNVFFQMALKENRLEGVAEIPFVSRSYNVG